ncbi:alpha/beta fold hydrolase [Aliiroseovarius sp. 2305UL8-7]|uniref:alpha/beta fold hydrolase n=1 Tax=Aliiroseovarius conchicola TaxID=3121637 RepID=UPI0035273EDB
MSEEDHNKIPSWYAEIFPAGPRDGWYHKLGQHAASFVDRGKSCLVVSFDNLSDAGYPHPDIEPWAAKFVRDNGWSHLGVYARGPSWFRDAQLISFLEKLRNDGFFAQFDRVALIGTSMGGFAALTFSSLAPGATVVALSPQSSLSPDVVPWEVRFAKGRAQDWSLPYSDAATQVGDHKQIYVIYDPFFEPDKRHVMRLPQARITHLKGFGFGHKTAVLLRRIEQLKYVMYGAISGTLSEEEFYKRAKARKGIYLYRVSMEAHLAERGHDDRVERFRTAFRRRRRLTEQLAAAEQEAS